MDRCCDTFVFVFLRGFLFSLCFAVGLGWSRGIALGIYWVILQFCRFYSVKSRASDVDGIHLYSAHGVKRRPAHRRPE
jgi:hypothetical protein